MKLDDKRVAAIKIRDVQFSGSPEFEAFEKRNKVVPKLHVEFSQPRFQHFLKEFWQVSLIVKVNNVERSVGF